MILPESVPNSIDMNTLNIIPFSFICIGFIEQINDVYTVAYIFYNMVFMSYHIRQIATCIIIINKNIVFIYRLYTYKNINDVSSLFVNYQADLI